MPSLLASSSIAASIWPAASVADRRDQDLLAQLDSIEWHRETPTFLLKTSRSFLTVPEESMAVRACFRTPRLFFTPCSHPTRGAQVKPTRPELPREFVAVHKRRRMMDAMAELSAEQGYEATKIADIVRACRGRPQNALRQLRRQGRALPRRLRQRRRARSRRRSRRPARRPTASGQQRVEAGLARLPRLRRRAPGGGAACAWSRRSRRRPAASARYDAAVRAVRRAAARATPRPTPGLPDTIEETLVGGVAWILQPADPPRRAPSRRSTCCPNCRSSCFLRTTV